MLNNKLLDIDYIKSKTSGTILYENSSGSNGNIVLSDNSSNYSYLEFDLVINPGATGETKKTIKVPLTSRLEFDFTNLAGNKDVYFRNTTYTLSGTSLNVSNYGAYYIMKSNMSLLNNNISANAIYITKVTGYK